MKKIKTFDISMLYEFGRNEDLAEWNKTQYELWLQLVHRKYVNLRDINTFESFAKFFFNFWKNNKQIPTVSDVVDGLQL